MFVRRRERDIFRKYPWLKIVFVIGGVVILSMLAILWIRGEAATNKTEEPEVSAEKEVEEEVQEESKTEEPEQKKDDASEITREVEQIGAGQIIALTFDDGPSEHTGKLLDLLKEKEVPATFFVLGRNANAHPDLVRREVAEGHEVESHTMNHQNLATLTEVGVRAEMTEAEQTICAIEGKSNCIKYLRPPYGEINNTVRGIASVPMIGWSIDTEDWKSKNPQMIQDRTLGVIRGGAIILMHDVYDTSVEGARRIINELKAAGFTFVTVDEMVRQKGANLAAGSYYGQFN